MKKSYSKMTPKEKEELRGKLSAKRMENNQECHYCKIAEKDFWDTWGKFYGLDKRGARLEVDHKDPRKREIDLENPDLDNLVFACALCNMAKSNMFYYDEFKKVGLTIEEIWKERVRTGRKPLFPHNKKV
jgi:hypothetical protein